MKNWLTPQLGSLMLCSNAPKPSLSLGSQKSAFCSAGDWPGYLKGFADILHSEPYLVKYKVLQGLTYHHQQTAAEPGQSASSRVSPFGGQFRSPWWQRCTRSQWSPAYSLHPCQPYNSRRLRHRWKRPTSWNDKIPGSHRVARCYLRALLSQSTPAPHTVEKLTHVCSSPLS